MWSASSTTNANNQCSWTTAFIPSRVRMTLQVRNDAISVKNHRNLSVWFHAQLGVANRMTIFANHQSNPRNVKPMNLGRIKPLKCQRVFVTNKISLTKTAKICSFAAFAFHHEFGGALNELADFSASIQLVLRKSRFGCFRPRNLAWKRSWRPETENRCVFRNYRATIAPQKFRSVEWLKSQRRNLRVVHTPKQT